MWRSLRQGARNIAGVTYQVAVTADILVRGRVGSTDSPSVYKVVPEGFEDIDCTLGDGRRIFVQAKERGPGARPFGVSDLGSALAHAAEVLGRTIGDKLADARFVVVTDGELGAGVPDTGWTNTVPEILAKSREEGSERLRALTDSIRQSLDAAGHSEDLAVPLISVTSVVRRPWHLRLETERTLRTGLRIHPSVANLVYVSLVNDLSRMAAEQRARGLADAAFRTIGDLDALIARVQAAVNVDALEEATRSGVVESVDFLAASTMTEGEFFAGVDVTPAHVAAGLDVPRIDELSAIFSGLNRRNEVVVAGPSGSGKSALLWRAARDVGRGARPVRVLRCSSDADVALLVRHARLQQPSTVAPMLFCVDDLGRDAFTYWTAARDQLLGVPGVMVLTTVRREDFTPDLAGSATVVDSRINQRSAEAVYDRLVQSGARLAMEPEEAISRAEGLLMEFIALATTGNRLETVLSAQVERLAEPNRRLQRRCLRLVAAAHTLGSAVPADALGNWITRDGKYTTDDVSDALAALVEEHLLRPDVNGAWRGLHDLRTEVLLRALHTTPPPTLAATFAEILPLLPLGRRGFAMRRAAERLAGEAVGLLRSDDPQQSLDQLGEMIAPIARAAGEILSQLPSSAAGAMDAADLLDGALRADAAMYTAVCMRFLAANSPAGVDLQNVAFVTFSIRNAGIQMPNQVPAGRRLNSLGRQLPQASNKIRKIVGDFVTTADLAELAVSCTLPEALVLLEAAEGSTILSSADAERIWSHHVGALPEPPGRDLDERAADHRARLAATLDGNGAFGDVAASEILGTLEARAADAVAADSDGLSIETALARHRPRDDDHSALIRSETFAPGQLLILKAEKLESSSDSVGISGYPSLAMLKGDGSINDQAVILARRLFDVCPEADRVDIKVLQANLSLRRYTGPSGVNEDGNKQLRRGVLPRDGQTRFNVACIAAMSRLLAAGSWSERLRKQALVAADLVALLEETLQFLPSNRNARRLRDLAERARRIAADAAALPKRPTERLAGESWTEALSVSSIDNTDRSSDRAHVALGRVADALVQLTNGLVESDSGAANGAGWRLVDAPSELEDARREGAPTYAGIGETLPIRVDELAKLIGDALLAVRVSPRTRHVLDQPQLSGDVEERTREAVATAEREQEVVDRRVVRKWLSQEGFTASDFVMVDRKPPAGRLGLSQVLAIVPVESWSELVISVQNWPPSEREELSGAAVVMPVDGDLLIPLALRVFGNSGSALPVADETVLADASVAAGMQLLDFNPLSTVVRSTVDSLIAASRERVREAQRDQIGNGHHAKQWTRWRWRGISGPDSQSQLGQAGSPQMSATVPSCPPP